MARSATLDAGRDPSRAQHGPRCAYGRGGQLPLPDTDVPSHAQYSTRSRVQGRGSTQIQSRSQPSGPKHMRPWGAVGGRGARLALLGFGVRFAFPRRVVGRGRGRGAGAACRAADGLGVGLIARRVAGGGGGRAARDEEECDRDRRETSHPPSVSAWCALRSRCAYAESSRSALQRSVASCSFSHSSGEVPSARASRIAVSALTARRPLMMPLRRWMGSASWRRAPPA